MCILNAAFLKWQTIENHYRTNYTPVFIVLALKEFDCEGVSCIIEYH